MTNQPDGTVKASYGYTPYGALDATLSKGDTSLTTPFNPSRYSAKRFDSGAKNYDMGVRRYDPTAQRFLQLDQFQGALDDLALASDPLTQNRYDLGASNPLSGIEWDGHMVTQASAGGGCAPNPSCVIPAPTRATPQTARLGAYGCNPFVFKLGACESERGAAGTTPEQVKQSFLGALNILATTIPVAPALGAAAKVFGAARLASKFGEVLGPAARVATKLGGVLGSKLADTFGGIFTKTAAEDEGGLVNLASDARTQHILSGHMPPGEPGNTLFPSDWSAAKIMNGVSEVATDPANQWVQQTGRLGAEFTRAGDPVRYAVEGVYDDLKIRAIIEPGGEGIITGFPVP